MSKIEYAKDPELSAFYHWLYSGVSDNIESNNIDCLYNAAYGMIFVVLHELAHTRSDLIEITENLFKLEASKKFFEQMTDKQVVEIACDFDAFSMINMSIENKILENIDITNLVKNGFLSLLILEIYSFLKNFDLNDMETASSNISKSLEHSLDFIEKRFATLVKLIIIAKNSDMFSVECDITSILDDIKEIMSSFFECFDCFLLDLKQYIDKYDSLENDEKKQFLDLSEHEVWFSLI